MAVLEYNNKKYSVNASETALECLLRNKIDYPSSCQSGTCQSCLSKMTSGQIKPEWQVGLKPTLVAQNYMLPCICQPENDICISLPNEGDVSIAAKISDIFQFNHNIIRLRIAAEEMLAFKAGQYINLVTPEGIVRSYSIANLPDLDGYIELHIKLMPKGIMSQWLLDEAAVGMPVHIRGPMGSCFYCNPKNDSFPIVLAGTGTGVAPLIGVVLDALHQYHQGDIFLIHGGVVSSDLYLNDQLERLALQYENFHYKKCTLEKSEGYQQMPIDQLLLTTLDGIAKDARLFICGPEETTKKLKMKAFLAGVPSSAIYSDAFITPK